jgi:hypothetical protein
VVTVVVWHGDTVLMQELISAIAHNCSCQGNNVCGAHQAMLEQRFADGMLWGRWMRERLLAEEHGGRRRATRRA